MNTFDLSQLSPEKRAKIDGMPFKWQQAFLRYWASFPQWTKSATARVFDAYRRDGLINDGVSLDAVVRDSDTFFFPRQLEQIQQTFVSLRYRKLMANDFIPQAPEPLRLGARKYTVMGYESVGEARVIVSGTEEIPLVDTLGKEASVRVIRFALGYLITLFDRMASDFAAANTGLPINYEDQKMMGARRGVETTRDRILSYGLAEAGVDGFLTLPAFLDDGATPPATDDGTVPIITLPNGNWPDSGTTSDDIITDIQYAKNRLRELSQDTYFASDLIIPPTAYAKLSIPVAGTAVPIMQFVREAHPDIALHQWYRCSEVPNVAKPRGVIYEKSPEVVQRHSTPGPQMTAPVQTRPTAYEVEVYDHCGGVGSSNPKGMAYILNFEHTP